MNDKPCVPVLLALVLVLGCSRETTPPAEAPSNDAILASTAPAPPKPLAPPPPATEPSAPSTAEATAVEPPVESDTPPSFAPELEPGDGLSIQRLVTAPAVEHREPVAPSTIFASHENQIYAFLDVRNESDEAKRLVVYFIGPDGFASGGAELDVPPKVSRWRTWAFTKHAKEPGLWRVEVRSGDGELLGALPFEVDHGC